MKNCNVEQGSVKSAGQPGRAMSPRGRAAVAADISPMAEADDSRAARGVRRHAKARALLHPPPLSSVVLTPSREAIFGSPRTALRPERLPEPHNGSRVS